MRGWYLLCFGAKEKEREREEKEKEKQRREKERQQQTSDTSDVEMDETQEEEENSTHEELQLEINHNISKVTSIGQQALPPLMSIVALLDQVNSLPLRFHSFTSSLQHPLFFPHFSPLSSNYTL